MSIEANNTQCEALKQITVLNAIFPLIVRYQRGEITKETADETTKYFMGFAATCSAEYQLQPEAGEEQDFSCKFKCFTCDGDVSFLSCGEIAEMQRSSSCIERARE